MAESVEIEVTSKRVDTGKELAFDLFDQGMKPRDPVLKELGLKNKSLYNYYQDWKKANPDVSFPEREEAEGSTIDPKDSKKTADVKARSGTPTAPIAVGKITITPENWGMTQYGALLIIDTYNKAKRDIGYSGTMGEFLCDMCDFYRRILNYGEVENVREVTGEGGGGSETDGGAGTGQNAEEL